MRRILIALAILASIAGGVALAEAMIARPAVAGFTTFTTSPC
jgi:hypothetical protein